MATIKGATLIFGNGASITSLTGSLQTTNHSIKGTHEKYMGPDGEYNATAGFGKEQDVEFTFFSTQDPPLPTQYAYCTVACSDALATYITGANWQFLEADFKRTNKGPVEWTVKLWRAPGVTT